VSNKIGPVPTKLNIFQILMSIKKPYINYNVYVRCPATIYIYLRRGTRTSIIFIPTHLAIHYTSYQHACRYRHSRGDFSFLMTIVFIIRINQTVCIMPRD